VSTALLTATQLAACSI